MLSNANNQPILIEGMAQPGTAQTGTAEPALAVAVLAAGKGTRMRSGLPKVLHPLAGRPLLDWVLASCAALEPGRRLVIVGHEPQQVQQHLQQHEPGVEVVLQQPQRGTGHAVQQLLDPLAGFSGTLLVLNGDVPLLRPGTLAALLQRHHQTGCAASLLTACLPDPGGYGRVFCDNDQRVTAIVEDRDCTEEQRRNSRINGGIYCFAWPALAAVLPELSSDNSQGELYLTDAVARLAPAVQLDVEDASEISGINNRGQLASCEQILQQRLRDHWLAAGVTFVDPPSCSLSADTHFAADVVVEPQTHFRGHNRIGTGCRIGPGTLVDNCRLAEQVEVLFSVVRQATIARGSVVGPFAHLRQGATVGEGCKVGNFVEIKQSRIGNHTKASHLSYIGDAELGARVNVGAGTITANFDGLAKHRTVIGAGARTGANAVLVAPVAVGAGAVVAAGSTITSDVADDALAIARCRQVVKENWAARKAPGATSVPTSTPAPVAEATSVPAAAATPSDPAGSNSTPEQGGSADPS